MIDKDKHEINHKIVDVKRAQARGVAPPSIHEKQMAAAAAAAAAAAPRATVPEAPASGPAASSSTDPSPEQLHCKIFVGGIPPQIDRDELKVIFTEFGTVIDAIVMMDPLTQRSRCFGFVTFDPAQDGAAAARRAIAAQPLPIQGRPVEVKLATPRADPSAAGGAALAGGMPKRPLPPVAKHVGLRAGVSSTTTGEYAGLAVAFGRSGWKAGYGTKAFGAAGWNIFEDTGGGPLPEPAGFSFEMLKAPPPPPPVVIQEAERKPRRKRARR
jgi:RNA recognition motif. (a.k.a. RRM, RBD, or RNP domain)